MPRCDHIHLARVDGPHQFDERRTWLRRGGTHIVVNVLVVDGPPACSNQPMHVLALPVNAKLFA